MSGRAKSVLSRLVIFLICLIMITTMADCAPNISEIYLSDEDLQKCDETAGIIKEQFTFTVPEYNINGWPHLKTPAEFEITSPLNASVLPFGPVKITFTQPSPDPSITHRGLKVYVTPFDAVFPIAIYYPINIVPASYSPLEMIWKPNTSGKFIILVMFRNFKPGGNPNGLPHKDFGPYTVETICIQIEQVSMQGLTENALVTHIYPVFPTMTVAPFMTSFPPR